MDTQVIPEGAEYWANRKLDDTRKDWRTKGNFVEEYWASRTHPHRKLILAALERLEPFQSLLEIGCASGPNLKLISERWPFVELYGIDINKHSIEFADSMLPKANFAVGNVLDLPSGEVDVILADASLMYLLPEEIQKAMDIMSETARKGVVICDFESDSTEGKVVAGHWGRNYTKILEGYGFTVAKIKLTKEDWPSDNWINHGYIWIGKK